MPKNRKSNQSVEKDDASPRKDENDKNSSFFIDSEPTYEILDDMLGELNA